MRDALLGSGTTGNEQLTAVTGVLLIVLLAALGVTILRIGQLIWLHLFLGFLLVGPVLLKMASTGYRFFRYYTGDRLYVSKGPPQIILRLIAPVVVLTTVAVFGSGIALMFVAPAHRGTLLLLHKASFIVWLGATGLHVLGHLPSLKPSLRAVPLSGADGGSGAAGRWIALAGALVGGLVLAVVLIPHFSLWTAPGAFPHDH